MNVALFMLLVTLFFFLLNLKIIIWRKKDILGIDTGSIDDSIKILKGAIKKIKETIKITKRDIKMIFRNHFFAKEFLKQQIKMRIELFGGFILLIRMNLVKFRNDILELHEDITP